MSVIRSSSRSAGALPMAKCSILLVEDQASVAQVIASTIHQRLGCRVLIATSMMQVREILASKDLSFFAAVSDLNLPDAGSGEVVDLLLEACLPVIAISGSFNEEIHESLIHRGVVDYVLKGSINAYEYVAGLLERLYRNQSIRVLVVDDSESAREMIRHMLETQLLQVGLARDGEEGLKVLERHPEIKLVLVDNHMPVLDGFRFVARVREKWGADRLCIIGFSGIEDKYVPSQFIKYGANDYMAKPFTYDELMCRVNQNLGMLESIERIRHAAYHDYLTGLFNRRYFFEQGARSYAQAVAMSTPLSTVMIDIDFFKKVNDTYGHANGDLLLTHMGAMLRKHFPRELLARMGGEEFALLVPGTPDEVLKRVEVLRQEVANTPVNSDNQVMRMTISAGVSLEVKQDLEAALKVADRALYQAKEAGRNRTVCG